MESVVNEIVSAIDEEYDLEEEQKEILQFGLQGFFELSLNIVISILILCRMGMLKEGFVFFLAFIPLRTVSGGYHAESYFRCLIYSVLTLIVVLIAARKSIFPAAVAVIIACVVAVIIGWMGPIANPKRPISAREYRKFRKRLWFILICEIGVMAVLAILQTEQYIEIILYSLVLQMITLILGKTKYSKYQTSG